MFAAFFKSLAQLGDPAIRRVLWIACGLAAVVLGLLWAFAGQAAAVLAQSAADWPGWARGTLELSGVLIVPLLAWLLFPAAMNVVIAWLLEDVAQAVESRHYPGLPPAREAPLVYTLTSSLMLAGKMIALNLAILPLLLVPPVFPFVFYGVNGYLLGREYFELAAVRRVDPDRIGRIRTAHRGGVVAAGIVTALLLSVPIVNLVAPIVATAAMVHLVESWRRTGE